MKDEKARDAIRQLNREQIEIRECPNCGHNTPQVPVGCFSDEFNRTTQANRYDCLTCGCRISMGHVSGSRNKAMRGVLDKALDLCERMVAVSEATLGRLEKAEGEIKALKPDAAKPKGEAPK